MPPNIKHPSEIMVKQEFAHIRDHTIWCNMVSFDIKDMGLVISGSNIKNHIQVCIYIYTLCTYNQVSLVGQLSSIIK